MAPHLWNVQPLLADARRQQHINAARPKVREHRLLLCLRHAAAAAAAARRGRVAAAAAACGRALFGALAARRRALADEDAV